LRPYWDARGALSEERTWLELAASQETLDPTLRVDALVAAAVPVRRQGDLARSRALDEAALALAGALEDRGGRGVGLWALGNAALIEAALVEALLRFEEGLALARAHGHPFDMYLVCNLGLARVLAGDAAGGEPLLREGLAEVRVRGEAQAIGIFRVGF